MKKWDYKDGSIIHGDCLEVMKTLPDNYCDLICGSPPYETARDYLEDGEDLGIARETEEWVSWMVEIVKESVRVCSGLVAYVVGHGKGARQWSGAPALLCADLIRGGVCLRSPSWYKRNGIMGSGGSDWLRADVEWIVCATKEKMKLPWSDNTACGKPPRYKAGGNPTHRDRKGNRKPSGADGYKPPELSNPGNVIDVGSVGGGNMGSDLSTLNEAPYHIKVPEFFIRSFCPPGGLVMDCFGGSGTTVDAAIRTGRRFLMIDLRKSQVELMKKRIKVATMNKGFVI